MHGTAPFTAVIFFVTEQVWGVGASHILSTSYRIFCSSKVNFYLIMAFLKQS